MITPRTTRLVRAPDLHTFRNVLVDLACGGAPLEARDRLVVVPTRAAGAHLVRSIERRRLSPGRTLVLPDIVTPAEIVGRLAERLPSPGAVLSPAEREVLLGVACRDAAAAGSEPPFRLRPGLIAEILAFFDTLQRQQRDIDTFERLALQMLEPGAEQDRGAERLVRQTKFLTRTFRLFVERCEHTGGVDEHVLRRLLIQKPVSRPWRHVIVAVGDHGSEPEGLFPADWDLLTRVPGLEQLDLVDTDGRLAGAWHQRVHRWLPGIEEVRAEPTEPAAVPSLLTGDDDAPVQIARDREEEVAGFARWVRHRARTSDAPLDRHALVVQRPLPYVYLARDLLASAGIPVQMFDALPLAAEPYAAALDLVFDYVSSNGARGPAVSLLRSPQFRFGPDVEWIDDVEVAALDRALSDAGYLGGLDALETLVTAWHAGERRSASSAAAVRAADALAGIARELLPLARPAACATHLDVLLAFLDAHDGPPPADPSMAARHLRARAAVINTLRTLRHAHARFDAEPVELSSLTNIVRRWIDGQTFAPRAGETGVHVGDAASVPFGDFDAVQLAGVVEGEWPVRPRRNILYSPAILRELGWPSETERHDSARAAFAELLRLPAQTVVVSAFALEDEAPATVSSLADDLDSSGLPRMPLAIPAVRIFQHEALGGDPIVVDVLPEVARPWAARRLAAGTRATGITSGFSPAGFSLSALERYQDCPFKYFAADVIGLVEPPVDEPSIAPRVRGRLVHEIFQRFFEAWDARGSGTITPSRIDEARELMESIAAPLLARLTEADAALERARLFGSPIAPGIADVVLGIEASRPADVQARWLEHRFEGAFTLGDAGGREVPLRGVADRVDLLEGKRLRVIDYKTGQAPRPARALQAPIYALCAQERLGMQGEHWEVDEASYVAFSGRRPLVAVVRNGGAGQGNVLSAARERLFDVVDGIRGGQFPPRPYETAICSYCAFPSVCRKDYVE